jgi:Calcineurin-like phosphoesterase
MAAAVAELSYERDTGNVRTNEGSIMVGMRGAESLTKRIAATAALLLMGVAVHADEADYWQWTQYVPGGLEARVATEQATCPAISIDGAQQPMAVRSEPGASYPVRVCAAPIPAGAKLVTIGGAPLPLPVAHPNRILIVGDTGCRLKGKQIQACNDLSEWPFRLGATMSADFKPDLVLHVGDFHYRESACPLGNYACGGSPFGDTWDVWRADFFSPGDSLLRAAPWIFVRGNHEECDRGGKGWARTLDPYPYSAASGADGCLGPAKPFTVDIGGLTIEVMDVSTADERVNPAQVEWYKPQFAMAKDIPGPVWQTFHRPVWAVDSPKNAAERGDNQTLETAARDSVPANVTAFVSGHHHTFEVMSYEQDIPVQIVSGHGGDDLSPFAPKDVKGLEVGGMKIKEGIGRPRVFGFSMIERAADDNSGLRWTLTGYDTHGRPIGVCRLDGRNLSCD